MSSFPTLQELATDTVCRNIDLIFSKKLSKIKQYLRENKCSDTTDFFVDQKEAAKESKASLDPIDTIRRYLTFQYLPPLVWKEKYNSKLNKILIGLDIEGTKAEVPIIRGRTPRETTRRIESAKIIAAELMIKKLYSKHLQDSVLNDYLKQKAKIPVRARKSDSFLRQDIPEWVVLSVDDLVEYGIPVCERWEILRRVPEHLLCRSHFLLFLPPSATEVDFSVCPALISPNFLKIVSNKTRVPQEYKKRPEVERVNFSDCTTLTNDMVDLIIKAYRVNIRSLNLNRCTDVNTDGVFRLVRKYNLSLKELYLSGTRKKETKYFHRFFTTSPDARRIYTLDFSRTTLCVDEVFMITMKCNRLQKLNLAETEMVELCYCEEHDNVIDFTTTVVKQLRELNVSCSNVAPHILSLLVNNNPGLQKLFASTRRLITPDAGSTVEYKHLKKLASLDISFVDAGFEDFSNIKNFLPSSIKFMDASGYLDLDISHLAVSCPYISHLILNSCKFATNFPMQSYTDDMGTICYLSHSLNNFKYLRRLEISYTDVDFVSLFETNTPLPLQEMIIRGDVLTDRALFFIVNQQTDWTIHLFKELQLLHLHNCNMLTDFGIEKCEFLGMPSLTRLIIERCSGIRPGRLRRMKHRFTGSQLSLTCFINDEKPKVIQSRAISDGNRGFEIMLG